MGKGIGGSADDTRLCGGGGGVCSTPAERGLHVELCGRCGRESVRDREIHDASGRGAGKARVSTSIVFSLPSCNAASAVVGCCSSCRVSNITPTPTQTLGESGATFFLSLSSGRIRGRVDTKIAL